MNKNKVLKDLVPAKAKKAEAEEQEEEGGGEMAQDINSVDLIVRREIEALIASPLIEAYSQEFGKEA